MIKGHTLTSNVQHANYHQPQSYGSASLRIGESQLSHFVPQAGPASGVRGHQASIFLFFALEWVPKCQKLLAQLIFFIHLHSLVEKGFAPNTEQDPPDQFEITVVIGRCNIADTTSS